MPLYKLLYRSDVSLKGSQDDVDRQIGDIVRSSALSNSNVFDCRIGVRDGLNSD